MRAVTRGFVGAILFAVLVVPGEVSAQDDADHSPGQAFTLSLLGTAAPIAAGLMSNEDGFRIGLIGAGVFFGPATGYWFGGASGRGWRGVGFRGIVLGATAAAVYGICNIDRCDIFDDNEDATVVALVVTLLGGAVIAGSSIIDVVEAPAHVRAANEARRSPTLSLAPVLLPSNGGTLGLTANLRF